MPGGLQRADEVLDEELGPAPHERHLGAADADVHGRWSSEPGASRPRITPSRGRTALERTGSCSASCRPASGRGMVGGAETVMPEIAHGLAARGWDVEILTTCARDHFTWANEFPPAVEDGDA